MKKYILLLFSAITMLFSCNTADYDAILEQLRDHEERIQKLETLCNQLNSNIEAVQTILAALEQQDYITDITKITEAGIEIGYSITFAKGGTINIYHGTDGSNAQAPKISIRKASDGEYYWTSDDEWLTDENGDKIPASVPDDPDGKYTTPQFRVSGEQWYVSFDNGNSWRQIESPDKDDADRIFTYISYDSQHLYLTLSDGTILTVKRGTDTLREEGEDLTHLFDFDTYPAESYSVNSNGYIASTVFDSAMADLSAYAGRTIEITLPQYANMNGKNVGYAAIMTDKDKGYIRTLKTWEAYPAGTKNGILKTYRITLPEDMQFIYTSTYMTGSDSYIGENDGRTDFFCRVLPTTTEADITYGEDEICDYFAIGTDGKAKLAEGYGCTSFINCKDALFMRISMIQHTSALNHCLCFYDADKRLISSIPSLTGSDTRSVTCRYDIPAGAHYFKASYFSYDASKEYGSFACTVSYPDPSYVKSYRPYIDGITYFSPKVNVAVNRHWESSGSVQMDSDMKATTGVLVLPPSYDPEGEPVPLIMYCHGASHGVWYGTWGATDNFRLQKQHWTDMGFAVFDCTGAENNNRKTPFTSAGSPQFVNAYHKCYEYIRKHYNVSEDIYVCGVSAGGPVALNYTFTHSNVKALVLLSTWVDIAPGSGHEWDQGYRNNHVRYLGFDSTTTYDYEKAKGTNPADHIVTIDGTDYLIGLDVPVQAMIGGSEKNLPDLYRFIEAAQNSGNRASIRVFPESYTHTQICSGADIIVDTEVGNWFLTQ